MIDNPVAWIVLTMVLTAIVIVIVRNAKPRETKKNIIVNTYNKVNWK